MQMARETPLGSEAFFPVGIVLFVRATAPAEWSRRLRAYHRSRFPRQGADGQLAAAARVGSPLFAALQLVPDLASGSAAIRLARGDKKGPGRRAVCPAPWNGRRCRPDVCLRHPPRHPHGHRVGRGAVAASATVIGAPAFARARMPSFAVPDLAALAAVLSWVGVGVDPGPVCGPALVQMHMNDREPNATLI